jgi:hypothetical protein
MHDLTTGKSCTSIIYLVNQPPVKRFSKCQRTVERVMYALELVAPPIATKQIMDLLYTPKMMGIPLAGKDCMFEDNQSVITSGTAIPHSSLSKHHTAWAYHPICGAISANMMWFIHINGNNNPSDVLTKFLGHRVFWPLIKPFLF